MINQLLNIHILKRNPTSRWVDFKTTHQLDGVHPKSTHAHPLPWGNNKTRELDFTMFTYMEIRINMTFNLQSRNNHM
jgi:hypothetical protein